jgi:hypothetical protein
MNLVNTWGLYPWSVENGKDLIHKEDLEKAKKLNLYGKVFKCIDKETNYIKIMYDNNIIRVKPELYKLINIFVIPIGYETRLKKYPKEKAIVKEIIWQATYEQPVYYITINGKKKTKRYFLEDFIVDNSQV